MNDKILLIEDDLEISEMLKSYLTAENYEVICAIDGQEACNYFDLVLLTIYEGRNRQIRRMCQLQGYQLRRLRRVAVGRLRLDKLPPGQWRYLTPSEVAYLRSLGPAKSGTMGVRE